MANVTRELPEGHSGRRKVRSSRRSGSSKSKSSSRAESNGHAENELGLSLPSQENIPPDSLGESIILIHGEKGVGKTSLASQFPNSIVFMFERARRNLSIFQVPQKGEPDLDWPRFKGYLELFVDSDEFSNGVIDTLDGCYMACFNWVCSEYGVASPDESENAPSVWDAIATEFGNTIYALAKSDKSLVITSHSKPKPLVAKRKGLKREGIEDPVFQFDRMEPSCKPAAFRIVQEMADYVFYYGYRDGHRAITVRSPLNIYWTSCGMGDRFLQPDGEPLETFKVGPTPELAYKSLQDAYHNKLWDIDYIPPSKPSGKSLGSSRSSRGSSRRSSRR